MDRQSYANYDAWLASGDWIRVSARALIFSRSEQELLIERVLGNEWYNFIGGGVEVGESAQSTIERELAEESDAVIRRTAFCFVVENFFEHEGGLRHSLEFYFRVWLAQGDVRPRNQGTHFLWVPIASLPALDLRPSAVRDAVVDGTFAQVTHLAVRDVYGA